MTSLTIFKRALALTLFVVGTIHADPIRSGSATFTVDIDTLLTNTPLEGIDGVFGITEERDELLSGELTPFNMTTETFTLGVNAPGTSSPAGRTIQSSTLNLGPGGLADFWNGSPDVPGYYLSGGDQIGIGGGLRFDSGNDTVLIAGDFALRYAPDLVDELIGDDFIHSGLVLTSNIDFGNVVFANLVDATISSTADSLSIFGKLLIGAGFGLFVGGTDLEFGSFSLLASTVPEPAAYGLILSIFVLSCVVSRRRRIRASD